MATFGVLFFLWALYHRAAMKLYRHVHIQYMKPEQIKRNFTKARHHTREQCPHLQKQLAKSVCPGLAFIVSAPFTGHGTLIAVDILTASGSIVVLPALLKCLRSRTEIMEELGAIPVECSSTTELN